MHRLSIRIAAVPSVIRFRCPACSPDPDDVSTEFSLDNPQLATLVGGITRPATILRKGADWFHHYFLEVQTDGRVPCTRCGAPVRVEPYRREGRLVIPGGTDGLFSWCRRCGETSSSSREGLVASLPSVRAFQRQLERIRIDKGRYIERAGRPAVVTVVESVTSAEPQPNSQV